MSAGRVIDQAYQMMAGTVGGMMLALEKKQPVPKPTIAAWVHRLRAAADSLEKLL